MIAVDIDQRCVETVGEEREVFAIQIAAADDEVHWADGAPAALVPEGGVELIGDRKEPNRRAASIPKRGGIRPFDRQVPGHDGAPPRSGGFSTGSGSSEEARSA